MYKKLYYTGILAYIAMLLFSILFYKERILFLDTAFTVFTIIKDSSFSIQVYRFGDVLTQWLPVLARRAWLPVGAVAMSYSVGFMVYYFACYLVCGSVLKQYAFALVLLLLNILFVSDTFYWITSQLPQSMALLVVVLAWLRSRENRLTPSVIILATMSIITAAFFHPLLLFVMVYAVLFFALHGGIFKHKKLLFQVALVYLAAIIIKALAFRTPYEQHSMSGLKNLLTLFPHYLDISANKRFLHNCLTKYYWLPILFVVIVVHYSRSGQWRALALFGCSFIGYLALINISYPFNTTPDFYIESLYLPLGVFIALPLIFDVLPHPRTQRFALPLLGLIVLSGCMRLYMLRPLYAARLAYERALLDTWGTQKVIVNATAADTAALLMTWGAPYELLLLSQIERHIPASIIIDENPDQRIFSAVNKNALVVNYNIIPYAALSPRYFKFTDTTHPYAIIKTR
jgi:hypothetical protein